MVAVVTGNTLGLVAGSAGVLGGNGQLGSAATGRGGDIAFVNASTGNLTIQRQDELLLGLGPDIGIVRTYNSQGLFDFDNNDNWQISLYRRVFGLTGTVNTAASTIKRTSADGAELTYTYDATLLKYVNKDGAGSFDTLTFNSAANTWTWVDGDSRTAETFELQVAGTYRIKNLADTDGNTFTYSYNNATDSLITQVLSANGERTDLIYNATKQLTQINVVNSSSVTTTRVRYTYENATATARLTSVSTDLSPADGVIADNNTYTTTYGYDGLSKRITSIVNSVGVSAISVTRTDFTYETTGAFRVLTVKDGTNNITTFAYPTTSTATVTDAKGQITTLTYSILTDSSQKLLTRVQGPAGSGQDINYLYDTNGNVSQMTDSRGNWTVYTYDVNGNQLTQQDMLGNTIVRTYTTSNQMLTETVYTDVDSTPGVLSVSNTTTIGTGTAQTTRYVYDNSVGGTNNRLRFIISPEGRVTEYRYNTNGTRASTIQYTGNLFAVAGAVTEAQLMTWVGATLYSEDFDGAGTPAINRWNTQNGNLAITNGKLNISSGPAAADNWPGFSSATTVTFAPGQLFRTEISLGALSPVNGRSFSLGIEGVGGRAHLIAFEDNAIKAMQNNAGVWSTFNSSLTASANTTYVVEIETTATGSILYIYQKGQSRAQGWSDVQATGAWVSYEVSGSTTEGPGRAVTADSIDSMSITVTNQAQVIDKSKSQRVDYTYDVRGQLWKTNTYKTINAVTGTGVIDANMAVTQYVYDQAGNLVQSVDARGMASSTIDDYVTSYSYDGLNRIISTSLYDATGLDANKVTTTTVYNDTTAAITTIPTGTTTIATNSVAVKLANGLVIISAYDAAGRLISTKNVNTANLDLGTTIYSYNTLGQLVRSTDATGQKTYYIYDSLGRKVGSIDPQLALTEYVYNNAGQIIRTISHEKQVSAALLSAYDIDFNTGVLTNSLISSASANWPKTVQGVSANFLSGTDLNATLTLSGEATMWLQQNGVEAIASYLASESLSVAAGKRYEVSIYTASHRANHSLAVQFFDVNGVLLGEVIPTGGVVSNLSSEGKTGGSSLSGYKRLWGFVNAPTGAVSAKIVARKEATLAGNVSSYMFVTSPYLGEATATQTTATPFDLRPPASAGNRINRNLYDKAGRLAKQIDAMGAVTEYQYDGASRLVKAIGYANLLTPTQLTALAALTTEPLATDVNTLAVVDAIKDRITRQLYSNDGLLLGKLDAEGYFSSYSYDAASRNTSVTRYKNAVQVFGTATLDFGVPTIVATAPTTGNVLYVLSDASNDQTSYNIYNARGQLEGTVDALSYLTEFQYDLAGNRTVTTRYAASITYTVGASVAASRPIVANPENQVSTATYDANNRITSNTSSPDGLITNYTYDAVGNLTQQVRTFTGATALNNRSQFKQYDQLGRVTQELSGEGVLALQALVAPTQAQIEGVWDSYGTRYSYDLAGRVIVAIAPNGTNAAGNKTLYYYDTEGKLKYQVNAVGEVTEFIYSQFDQRTATRQYKTRILKATLDLMTGGLPSLADATTLSNLVAGSYVETATTYDNAGRAATLTDALLNVNSRSYNAFGELLNSVNRIDQFNPATPVAPFNSVTTQYEYDKRGMVKQTIEDGTTTTPVYTGLNRITAAIYDAFGRITQTTDGRGGIVKRTYDRLGREVTVTDALNTQTQTSYDAFSRVTKRRDGRGVAGNYDTVSYSYNSTARTMTMTSSIGVSVITERNRFGETVTVTDGRGAVSTYTYNADGQLKTTTIPTGVPGAPTNSITTINYDFAGKVLSSVDAKLTQTSFTYDAANRVLSRTVDPISANPAGLNLTTEYRYDALGRQLWVKDAKGVYTRTDYDAKGQVTSMVVDPSLIPDATGNLANPLVANAAGLNITTSFTYDARGKRLTVTEGAGSAQPKTTAYAYDKLGRLSQTIVDPGVGKLNLTTSYTYDKNDNVVIKTDANLNKTVYRYDANNRLIYTVDALGNVTKNDYDVDGNVVTTTVYGEATSIATRAILATLQGSPEGTLIPLTTDASNRISRNVYDTANRRTFSIDALGYVTKYEYNANGNVRASTRYTTAIAGTIAPGVAPVIVAIGAAVPSTGSYVLANVSDQVQRTYYDGNGRAVFSTDALGYLTSYVYDANSNLTRTTQYANALVGSLASGAPPTIATTPGTGNYVVSSANDQVTQMTYDAANRVITSTNGLGIVTSYNYDAKGNQISIIEAFGLGTQERSTTQQFDAAGRKTAATAGITATDLIGYRTATTYDALGNITSVIDAKGAVGYFYYDAAGRMSLQVNPEGAVTETKYDALGNQTDIIRYSNKVSGTYNAATKPVIGGATGAYVTVNANLDQLQKVSYDTVGRKSSIKTAFANTGGQVLDATNSYTESFVYDAFGNVQTSTARNDATTNYTYDKLNRKFTEIVTGNNGKGVTVTLQSTKFEYDFASNLKIKSEAVGLPEQRITTYAYDLLNRQTQEIGQAFISFNPATQADVSVTPTKTKTYDVRGNVTSETDANGNKATYYYDILDRRIGSVTADGVYTKWTYDAVGNKIGQIIYANIVSNPTVGSVPVVTADTPNDRTTTYTYDKMGRQLTTEILNIAYGSVSSADNQYYAYTGSIKTQTVYDALGNVIKQIDANNALLPVADQKATRIWYDKAGQTMAQVDSLGYLTTWTRDVYGNITKETRYAKKPSAAATPLIVTDATTLAQLTTTAATLADAANDRITDVVFDRLNRVKTESKLNVLQGTVNATTGALTAPTAVTATTSYNYDALNNVTQKTDAVGAITNWVYDGVSRQVSQLNPTITDYLSAAVRPQMDKEYDGLNNVKREIARGKDNAVEADDQITTYEYGINGWLAAEINATGARTEYKYDANGNLTKSSLKGRLDADGVVVGGINGDTTIYSYDAQNRQTKTQDISTGLINEVQYNSFNQIAGKRTYTGAAPVWQETAQYDQAGRVWKSNSGDGVTKVSVYDQNGNATLSISGTLDMRNMSLTQVLAQKTADSLAGIAQQTLYTMSVYDAKNQLTNTIQPSMASTKDVVVVQSTGTGGSVFIPNALVPGTIGANGVAGTNPVMAGTATIGGLDVGIFNMSINYTSATISTDFNLRINKLSIGHLAGSGSIVLVVSLGPATLNLGFGTAALPAVTKILIFNNEQDFYTYNALSLAGNTAPATVSARSYQAKLYRRTALGDIELGSNEGSLASVYAPGYLAGNPPWPIIGTNINYQYMMLMISNQPPTTSKVLLNYRLKDSTDAFTTIWIWKQNNSAGVIMPGMYACYHFGAPGIYEFDYVALDAGGNILNQQRGTYNSTNPATLNVSDQIPIPMGSAGRAFITYDFNTSLTNNGLQLIEQGPAASKVSLKYRVKNSGAAWVTIPATSFIASTATTGFGLGSFTLPTAELGVFVSGSAYEVDFEVRDIGGGLIRNALGTLTVDANGNKSVSALILNSKLRLTQPTAAQYVDIRYKIAGSAGAYGAVTRLSTVSAGSGQFDWDASAIPAGSYDIDVQAIDTNGIVINRNQVIATLGTGTISVTSTTLVAIPQLLRVIPSQANVDYIKLGYRQKYNSNLVQNANMAQNGTGYSYTVDGVATGFDFGRNLSTDWTLAGEGTLFLHQTGTAVTNSHINSGPQTIAVQAGQRYEVSAYTGAHRANVNLAVTFVDAAGNAISEVTPTGGITTNNVEAAGGTTLAGYKQLWGFVTAPTNAVRAIVVVRKGATLAGNTDSWLFVSRIQFAVASATQTAISDPNNPALSTSNYILLPSKKLSLVAGVKQATIELPVTLANGEYEYQYTAYAADKLDTNAAQLIRSTTVASTSATVTTNGNTITKTGGVGSWDDADAYSANSFTGGAYVSAKVGQTNLDGMFGLNADPTTNKSYTSLDYAFHTSINGNMGAYENGVYVQYFGIYTVNDILAIEYAGNTVNYLKNGAVIRSVATTAGRTFYFDTSLANVGFSYNDVKFGAAGQSAVAVIYNANTVTKTGGTNNSWDSDAYSAYSLTGGAYVSAKAGQTNMYGMFGLNADPQTDKSYASLDYAWYPAADGNLYIYENANHIGSYGAYTPTDVMAIEYVGSTVNYLKNGVLIRSVATTANRTFYFDSSFHSTGFTLQDVQFGAVNTAKLELSSNVAHSSASGVAGGNNLIKTGATNGWDADAYSAYSLTGGAFVSAKAGQTNMYGMFGLNADPQTDKSYASLDYAWYPAADGNLYIHEGPANMGNYGAYSVNDILAIEYVGSNVKYLKNGVVMRTVATTADRTFYFDSSFHSTGFSLQDVQFRATAMTADYLDGPLSTKYIVSPLGSNNGVFTIATGSTANTRLDWVITNTASSSNQISRKQAYNAFGEVVQEIDGRNNVIDFTYNTLGKLTLKRDPIADITLANGLVQSGTRSQTEYTYDAIGRMVATKDANLNLNTQVWLAGGDGEQTLFERHADGGFVKRSFDIFGNKRSETDRINSLTDTTGRTSDFTYDFENRLTHIDRPQRLSTVAGYMANRAYDDYTYDAAGQRITHSTSSDVSTTLLSTNTRQTEKTYYDSLGRITKTKSYLGYDTQYSYVYNNAVTGISGTVGAGWVKTTTRSDLKTLVDYTDMFNRTTWHQDLGGHQFTYNYNQAGWLMSQSSLGLGAAFTGQNIAYEHYNNGYIKSIQDKATGMYTYYEYDQDGNKAFEGYISLKNPISLAEGAKDYYQYAIITYDAMNRMKTILDPKANISYEYDAASNRRMVKSIYHDGVNGAMRTQEYWYNYDSMNRFTTTMGTLNGARGSGVIDKGALGGAGVAIGYNFAGERVQASNAYDGSTESYVYTADGYLADVNIKLSTQTVSVLRSRRAVDALGRTTLLTQYSSGDATGVGSAQDYYKYTNYDQDSRVTSESGTDGPTTYYYNANGGELSQTTNVNGTTVNTFYNYDYWDDAKQANITNVGYNPALRRNNAFWKPGYSELKYDVNGHLVGANDAGIDGTSGTGDDRSFRYVNDAQGLILLRDEIAGGGVNRIQRFYYVDGKRVGDVGNDGPSRTDYVRALASQKTAKDKYAKWVPIESADFDQNYEPISPTYPGNVATSYTVRNGDTLQSIARTVWGDSAMWYLIADANGLASGSTLTTNMVLTIPNKVTNIHNNAGTFRPYNAGEAIGDVNPTLPTAPPPPRKKKKCGGFLAIIVAVVAIAAAFVVGPMVATAMGFAQGGIGAAVVGAAVGNVAGQLAGNALGVQSGFDFKSFGTSVLTAGITQGLLGSSSSPTGLGRMLQSAFGDGYAAIAARAVVGNVISQGVGNLTGSQKGFSWSSVAAAGVGAAAGAYVGGKVGAALANSNTGEIGKTASFFTAASQGVASNVASQLTQIALDGKGRLNWSSIAISAIGAGVGALAGYNDPKNGGKVAQASSANRPIMVAANEYTSNTFLGVTSDVAALGGGWAPEPLVTDKVEIIGRRLTPAQWAIEDAKTLAAETADRLMQMNFNRMIDNFRDNAADRVNRATGSNVAGFITYTLVDAHKMAFNAPSYAYNAVKNGYNRGGQIGSAMYNDPLNTGIGIGKSVLNFGPEAFNGAANLTKTSLNGISYLADPFSNIGQDFRATDAYNLTTQRYNGDAQLGGAIGFGILSAVGPGAVNKLDAIVSSKLDATLSFGKVGDNFNAFPLEKRIPNLIAGDKRANLVLSDLQAKYPNATIQNEVYLRNADGKIAIDPLSKDQGRRIDFVVIQDGKVLESIEVTSMKADKSFQITKEDNIRSNGGTFIKDRSTGQLIDISNVKTFLDRRN